MTPDLGGPGKEELDTELKEGHEYLLSPLQVSGVPRGSQASGPHLPSLDPS